MSLTVKTFDEKKIEASMNKEQQEYLRAHVAAIEGYKQTVAQAIKKIKDVIAENEVLRKALELACDHIQFSRSEEWYKKYIDQARQATKTGG